MYRSYRTYRVYQPQPAPGDLVIGTMNSEGNGNLNPASNGGNISVGEYNAIGTGSNINLGGLMNL